MEAKSPFVIFPCSGRRKTSILVQLSVSYLQHHNSDALLHCFKKKDKDLELCAVNLKLEQLDAELQDLNSQESKDEASLSKVRKQLRDIEAKAKDQEEELDEQAGTIQMLEQVQCHLISPPDVLQ